MRFSSALIFFSFALLVGSAFLKGTIYNCFSFEPQKNAIVEVNSTPHQKIISKDGTYSFFLPPGNYSVRSLFFENNSLAYSAQENVTIVSNGTYNLDLILSPILNNSETLITLPANFTEIYPPSGSFDGKVYESSPSNNFQYFVFAFVVIIISALAAFFILKKPMEKQKMPDDLQTLVSIIGGAGGRITQKELRKKLPLSEAKVSLMLSDLEEQGKIKKIKRGRGNIIILK